MGKIKKRSRNDNWLPKIVAFTLACVIVLCATVVFATQNALRSSNAAGNVQENNGGQFTADNTQAEEDKIKETPDGADGTGNPENNKKIENTEGKDTENSEEGQSDTEGEGTENSEEVQNGTEGEDAENSEEVQNGTEGEDTENSEEGQNGSSNITKDYSQYIGNTVSICLTGDLMCLAGQQYAAAQADGTYDFTSGFNIIKDFLTEQDLVIGNLETLLAESIPITSVQKEINGDPNCNGPESYLAALVYAGFDGLVTANNHCLDGGMAGIEETIANIDKYGLQHCGTYITGSTEKHYMIFEANSVKIAVISFTELINQRDSLVTSKLIKAVDCYDSAYAKQLVDEARNAGADYVIAYNHWGTENTQEIKAYQKEHARELAEAGIDFIVGSHPHCLQSAEIIITSDGSKVPCIYSLGNLVSSMTRDINNDTILAVLTLKVTENGVATENVEYIPCHVFGNFGEDRNAIVPTGYDTSKKAQKSELEKAEARIDEVMLNGVISKRLWNNSDSE